MRAAIYPAQYRVHIGYTRTGRDRWAYYATLEAARRACAMVFERTGIMLTIQDLATLLTFQGLR